MKRLVIAIDCDDVLIATTPYLVDVYNRTYGTNVTMENSHDSTDAAWEADRTTTLQRLSEMQATVEYGEIEPFDDAISAVRRLASHHELHLITARDDTIAAVTMNMIDHYLHNCFSSVEHVGHVSRTKGEVCKQLNADILIDDNLKHLISALSHGMSKGGALLFGDYPWNHFDLLPDGVERCADWRQVERKVNNLAKY